MLIRQVTPLRMEQQEEETYLIYYYFIILFKVVCFSTTTFSLTDRKEEGLEEEQKGMGNYKKNYSHSITLRRSSSKNKTPAEENIPIFSQSKELIGRGTRTPETH